MDLLTGPNFVKFWILLVLLLKMNAKAKKQSSRKFLKELYLVELAQKKYGSLYIKSPTFWDLE